MWMGATPRRFESSYLRMKTKLAQMAAGVEFYVHIVWSRLWCRLLGTVTYESAFLGWQIHVDNKEFLESIKETQEILADPEAVQRVIEAIQEKGSI